MKKKAIVLCILVIGGALVFFMRQERSAQREAATAAERLNAELSALHHERVTLLEAKKDLQADFDRQSQGPGTVQLLATAPTRQVYDKILPILQEHADAQAVVGLSLQSLPGQAGMLSEEEARNLAKLGWTYCYCFAPQELEDFGTDELAMQGWLDAVAAQAEELGLALAPAIYFPPEAYQDEFEPWLASAGLQVMILGQENAEHASISLTEKDLWIVNAGGWNSRGASSQLKLVTQSGGNLVFTIGNGSTGEQFTEKAFRSMLTRVDTYQKEDSLVVTSFLKMIEVQQETGASQQEQERFDSQMEALDDALAELKEKIQQRTSEYEAVQAGGTQ